MVVFSTAYLPPVQYFGEVSGFKEILIEACETYPRQTYRNRCSIYTANGALDLSIPVHKPEGNRTKTKEVRISYRENWQQIHMRAIESAYNASPFYLYYKDELTPFFLEKKYKYLLEFNTELFKVICNCCGIECRTKFTDSFRKEREQDYRNCFSPKKRDIAIPAYPQVFGHKFGFIPGLSIIDLLFNLGPETKAYLTGITRQMNR